MYMIPLHGLPMVDCRSLALNENSLPGPNIKMIHLQKMPQQTRGDSPEDWTGIIDSKARRRLQNRVNQRIFRKY